jgi:hypothetical protein
MTNIATLLKPLATTVATVAAGMMLFQPAPASATLLTNGDFSNGLSNWDTRGTVDVSNQNGSNIANLQIGSIIRQTLSTVEGSSYQVSFDVLNTSQDFSNYLVNIAGSGDFLSGLTSTTQGQFNHYSFDFTANKTLAVLSFEHIDPSEDGPIFKSFGPSSAPSANTFSIACSCSTHRHSSRTFYHHRYISRWDGSIADEKEAQSNCI